MNLLERYLIRAVIEGTLLVLAVLIALSVFINFVAQLDDVGTGSYGIADALLFVALTLPNATFEMLPIATLLGALLGLGNLASRSELIVMRSAGISMLDLVRAVAAAGLALTLLAFALGELIGPPAEQYAQRHRTLAKNAALSMADAESAWAKDGDTIVNVQQLTRTGRVGGVYIFTLDANHRLVGAARAGSAGFESDQRWQLNQFSETRFDDGRVTGRTAPQASWRTNLSPEILGLSVVDPKNLAGRGLLGYVGYLRENGLDSSRYEVALWARVAGAASVLVMAVLALPFVFGTLRAAGTGQRMTVGVLIGVTFVIASKTLISSGEVFNLQPFVVAWLPTWMLMLIAGIGLYRVR